MNYKRMKALRIKRGLTQQEISTALDFSNQQRYNYYETGKREPDNDTLKHIAMYFGVSTDYLLGVTDDLTPPEVCWKDEETMEVIRGRFQSLLAPLFETLNECDDHTQKMTSDMFVELRHVLAIDSDLRLRAMILLQESFAVSTQFIDVFRNSLSSRTGSIRIDKMKRVCVENYHTALDHFESGTQEQHAVLSHRYADFIDDSLPLKKAFPVYVQPAAAGTGNFLDSEDYELINIPLNNVSIQATFGVRVTGDSMEPSYTEGDIVFVKQQPTLESDEIGIFVFPQDGSVIKKYHKTERGNSLLSLNPTYAPIVIRDGNEPRIIGKVIGKLNQSIG